MRRQARLFAIVEYLRGRRTGVTAEILAERFSVTVRTIYRDLDSLRDGSLPLMADRGRGGGYALDRSYTLPPLNFTAREAALLITIGRWATEMRLLPFSGTLETALDKVRGALSSSAQRELVPLMDGLKFIGVPALGASPAVRDTIEQAWFEQRPIRIRYRSKNGETSNRIVRIRSVLMERTMTILQGEPLDGEEARGFRLDHIESATLVPIENER